MKKIAIFLIIIISLTSIISCIAVLPAIVPELHAEADYFTNEDLYVPSRSTGGFRSGNEFRFNLIIDIIRSIFTIASQIIHQNTLRVSPLFTHL